ncbi:hypothetical protein SMKI_16G0470 [Saccharomyces mikatae IFO 1815]|uniref:Uncharacterized protein n=1 Tax=Saccharomyces mikatae IFO 1815 TaxID=226126 RepID=A0AA35NDJ6_SACMI|nr:uncharacterized protein SMKI_16G0470 [Saccharomyces mikatae IFO 1815]CAI4036736.1 hypothetical protein SMKI_16G0470 [Saccharomyces mikatae IFO 1815]
MSKFFHHRIDDSCQKREFTLDRPRISLGFLQKRTDCTGSSCKVAQNSSSNVTVAVAVAVPIGTILMLLSIILIVVYRRSKKSSLVQGDLYYLPKMDSSVNSTNSEGNSTEKKFIYGSYDDFLHPSMNCSQSFRDYVKRIDEQVPSTYNIASLASQNNSKVTFLSKHIDASNKISTRPMIDFETTVSSSRSIIENDCNQRESGVLSLGTKNMSKYNSANRPGLHHTKHGEFETQFSKEEEESIDRIRSIYNIYFEKSNSTIRSSAPSSLRGEPKLDVPARKSIDINSQDNLNDSILAEKSRFRGLDAEEIDSNSTLSNKYEDATEYLQLPAPQKTKHVPSSVYSEIPFRDKMISEQSLPLTISPPNATSTRIASSIYSDVAAKSQLYSPRVPIQMPTKILGQPTSNFAQQHPLYLSNCYNETNDNYYYHIYNPSSLEHPQNYENIGELPTPTQLVFSASSHSLTSFKGRPKPPKSLKHVPAARLNGTAVNPMDHPEMFYSSPTKVTSAIPFIKQPCVPLPYQLRKSVVMTDPSNLSMKTRYRPAGSLSTLVRAQHLPGSSSTTTTSSPLSRRPTTQQNVINVRVSGLLDDSDVFQPPSVGQILPFSASVDDLRKQLGASHDYEIIS